MKKILSVILGILMLSIFLAGCTSQPATPTPVPTQTPVVMQPIATQSPLVGVWDLFSYNNGKGTIQTVITGSQTTADFPGRLETFRIGRV